MTPHGPAGSAPERVMADARDRIRRGEAYFVALDLLTLADALVAELADTRAERDAAIEKADFYDEGYSRRGGLLTMWTEHVKYQTARAVAAEARAEKAERALAAIRVEAHEDNWRGAGSLLLETRLRRVAALAAVEDAQEASAQTADAGGETPDA